ncbi:hypothetical protein [Salinibaculum rarum]|jgi:transcription elongation factor Elf1|uniref:hypothetical protein n=1 Tax=Salinibaculum rarum TaxID=3058903 RepID=UPI00265F1180|nr:hypothetical protein [Salinibaculum sp. KK48]
MTPSDSTPDRQPADKAMLYCPECSHESTITGDWTLHVLAHSITYECPNCGTVIESRRDETVLGADGDEVPYLVAER